MKITIPESLMETYVTGALFAGYHFAQMNPDWTIKLVEMASYSLTWPIVITCEVIETINKMFR